MRAIRIGSRGSQLARWQADHVASRIRQVWPEATVMIEIITTTGDRILDTPLARIGGKGLFTKEIEEALLAGVVDMAVHSLKDLPTELPGGLSLGAVLSRHDPSDVLIAHRGLKFSELPPGSRIGTSSLRRQAQLLHARNDLRVESLRGNVPTRLNKAVSGEYDAVVLARAGVERLGLSAFITEVLPTALLLPAPGQGALGIEIRSEDRAIAEMLSALQDSATRAATDAERAFLRALGGGCQVPIGALAFQDEEGPQMLFLEGMVASPDGSEYLRGRRSGPIGDPESIGTALAEELSAAGAGGILARLLDPTAGGWEAV